MDRSNRQFVPLLLIIFIYALGYFLVFPVFFRLVLDNSTGLIAANTSMTTKFFLLSLCIALEPFGYMIGAPIMGTWSDSVGRKKILMLSLTMTLLGYVLPVVGILKSNIAWIFVGRLLSGFASSSQSLAQSAVADMSKGKQKAVYFSIISVVMTLALLIGPPMGSYLSDPETVSWFDEKTPFYFAFALILFTMILTSQYYNDVEQHLSEQFQLTLSNISRTVTQAFSTNTLRNLFLLFFLSQLGWSFFYQDTMVYLTQRFDYSIKAASNFMAYAGVCMALGLSVYKYIIRIVSLQHILLFSFLSCALSFSAWAIAPHDWELYFIVIPGAVGAGLAQPTIMTLLSDSVPQEKQGWVLGFAAAAFATPWCISALSFGVLSHLNLNCPLLLAVSSFALGLIVIILGAKSLVPPERDQLDFPYTLS